MNTLIIKRRKLPDNPPDRIYYNPREESTGTSILNLTPDTCFLLSDNFPAYASYFRQSGGRFAYTARLPANRRETEFDFQPGLGNSKKILLLLPDWSSLQWLSDHFSGRPITIINLYINGWLCLDLPLRRKECAAPEN